MVPSFENCNEKWQGYQDQTKWDKRSSNSSIDSRCILFTYLQFMWEVSGVRIENCRRRLLDKIDFFTVHFPESFSKRVKNYSIIAGAVFQQMCFRSLKFHRSGMVICRTSWAHKTGNLYVQYTIVYLNLSVKIFDWF